MNRPNTRRGSTQNVIFCPPCGESVAVATKEGQNRKNALWPLLPRLSAVLPPQGREMFHGFTQSCHPEFISGSSRYNNKMLKQVQHDGIKGFTLARAVTPQGRHAGYSGRIGFTLIELLVVVLIIGILSAVALPHYRMLIAKTHYSKLMAVVKSIKEAQEVYYLSHGQYAKNEDFEKLDIHLPNGTTMGVLPWGSSGIKLPEGTFLRLHTHSITNELMIIGTDVTNVCNNYMVVLDHSAVHKGKYYCQTHYNTTCDVSLGHKVCQRAGGISISTDTYKLPN